MGFFSDWFYLSLQFHGLSIKCVRVGGVEIPNTKRIEYSLQYIHGIGRSRARQILYDISMDNKITKDLSEDELIALRDEVSKYMIEGDLVLHFLSFLYIYDIDIFVIIKLFFGGVSEAVQCTEHKEIEGDSVLQRDKTHSGASLQRTAHQEQLPHLEG